MLTPPMAVASASPRCSWHTGLAVSATVVLAADLVARAVILAAGAPSANRTEEKVLADP
jgi:hypothetical protein